MTSADRARELLGLHGEVRPQPATDWTGAFPIPPAVEEFYREVGPVNVTIESHGNPYFLPSLADLWKFQAGYRWDGLTGESIEGWSDDWLVVADLAGEPFIFERTSGTILHALTGGGSWDPTQLFPDLNTMAAFLSQIGAFIAEAGDSYMAEDYSIRPEFSEMVADRLDELLGSKGDAAAVLDAIGWG